MKCSSKTHLFHLLCVGLFIAFTFIGCGGETTGSNTQSVPDVINDDSGSGNLPVRGDGSGTGTSEGDGSSGPCVPSCQDKSCGDDGCGGICGTCNEGQYCDAGACVVGECQPSCEGKQCGDNGCGGPCGSCLDGSCNAANQCECEPQCGSKTCGDDGCDGSCGSCGAGDICDPSGACIAADACNATCTSWDAHCGAICGQDCGTCDEGDKCVNYRCECDASCSGKQCGDDGCAGSCGGCLDGSPCVDNLCTGCVPQCDGKTCGDDACGGTCGECAAGEICDAMYQCIASTCCEEHASPGCNDPVVENCVCTVVKPTCCDAGSTWDEICVEAATAACGFECEAAAGSCVGQCGKQTESGCWCDAYCVQSGDCCPDACEACDSCEEEEVVDEDSCEGICGEKAPSGCWCDDLCLNTDDCCDDACDVCGKCDVVDTADSCVGKCGGLAESGCDCSPNCYASGNCCEDVCQVCEYCPTYTCADGAPPAFNICGSGYTAIVGCSCALDCYSEENCCPDIVDVCCPGSADDCIYAPEDSESTSDSCLGHCGGSAGECWCDESCASLGDCCDDACVLCDACEEQDDPSSCVGYCDVEAPSGCSCASDCYADGDCCSDVASVCGYQAPQAEDSCAGYCGEQAPGGCYCDEYCLDAGDCCDDACDACGSCVDDDSCRGRCGTFEATPSGCHCDSNCGVIGDCCGDACLQCGFCDSGVNACDLDGACAPGAQQYKNCGFCGYQIRSCNAQCMWEPWPECTGAGECVQGSSQPCPGACGTRTCITGCNWGGCGYNYDEYEPNNTENDAHFLGTFTEGDDIPSLEQAWVHAAPPEEVDWYRVSLNENDTWWDFFINLKVSLTSPGKPMSLCVIYQLKNGLNEQTNCVSGSGVLTVVISDLDILDPFIDDDAEVSIEVKGQGEDSGTCVGYTLSVVYD